MVKKVFHYNSVWPSKDLRDLIHLVEFPSFFTRETTFLASCLLSVHKSPSEKGSILKGKNLHPLGANSFLLEWTPFQKGTKSILTKWSPLKIYQFPFNTYL